MATVPPADAGLGLQVPTADVLDDDRARADATVDTRWGLLALPIFFYGLTFSITRSLGEAAYLPAIACALVACIGAQRLVLFRGQALLIGLSCIYLLLSYYDVLPRAWTMYHDLYAALRHWSPMIALPVITTAYVLLLTRYRDFIVEHALKLLVIVLAIRTVSRFWESDPSFFDGMPLGRWSLYSPNNETLPVFLLCFIAAHRGTRMRLYQLVLLLVVVPLSTSAGTSLAALFSLALRFIRAQRLAVIILFVSLLAFLAVSPFFYNQLFDLDGNTGVRTIFWRDAQTALVMSHGLGVGYGTEFITNFFGDIGRMYWYVVEEDADSRLFVSTHSTFYDVGLRLGVLGGVLFIVMMYDAACRTTSRLATPAAGLLLIGCAVTPAITTVDTQIGMGLLFAWLYVERQRATSQPEEAIDGPAGGADLEGRV